MEKLNEAQDDLTISTVPELELKSNSEEEKVLGSQIKAFSEAVGAQLGTSGNTTQMVVMSL